MTFNGTLFHIPFLRFDGQKVPFLNGHIGNGFEDVLMEIDRDWMRSTFLEKSKPVFWANDSKAMTGECMEDLQNKLNILIYSLICFTSEHFVHCDISMGYRVSDNSCSRKIGLSGRNLVLHNNSPILVGRDFFETIVKRAEWWINMGVLNSSSRHLLEPVKSLVAVSYTSPIRTFAIFPLIVELEGMLLTEKGSRIQKRLIDDFEQVSRVADRLQLLDFSRDFPSVQLAEKFYASTFKATFVGKDWLHYSCLSLLAGDNIFETKKLDSTLDIDLSNIIRLRDFIAHGAKVDLPDSFEQDIIELNRILLCEAIALALGQPEKSVFEPNELVDSILSNSRFGAQRLAYSSTKFTDHRPSRKETAVPINSLDVLTSEEREVLNNAEEYSMQKLICK